MTEHRDPDGIVSVEDPTPALQAALDKLARLGDQSIDAVLPRVARAILSEAVVTAPVATGFLEQLLVVVNPFAQWQSCGVVDLRLDRGVIGSTIREPRMMSRDRECDGPPLTRLLLEGQRGPGTGVLNLDLLATDLALKCR